MKKKNNKYEIKAKNKQTNKQNKVRTPHKSH